MAFATVAHEGETLTVDLKNVSLPSGFRLVAPNETPSGFFTQADLDEKIEDRLKRERKKFEKDAPGEKDVVLTGPDAEAYRLLTDGATLGEVKERLTKAQEQAGELERLNRREELRTAADALGWDFGKFKRLAGDLSFSIEGEDDEREVRVEPSDDDGKAVPATEHEAFKPFLDVLPAGSPPPTPPVHVPQRPSGQPPKKGADVEDAKQRKAKDYRMI